MSDILHLLLFFKAGEICTIVDSQLRESLSDDTPRRDGDVILFRCSLGCGIIGDNGDFVRHRCYFTCMEVVATRLY